VEDRLRRFVKDCVPALADSVEHIVHSILETDKPVIGIEVAGQRAGQVEERCSMTYWHPLRTPDGEIVAQCSGRGDHRAQVRGTANPRRQGRCRNGIAAPARDPSLTDWSRKARARLK
jgi:hypothetical protein